MAEGDVNSEVGRLIAVSLFHDKIILRLNLHDIRDYQEEVKQEQQREYF